MGPAHAEQAKRPQGTKARPAGAREMYYFRTGHPLTQVGTTSQSHASSKGGRTIIWERSGDTTEILAIGKHTTRTDTKLSNGASDEIVKTFADSYAGYTGKIMGFKARRP